MAEEEKWKVVLAEEKGEGAVAAEKGDAAIVEEKGKGAMAAAEKGKGPVPAAASGKTIRLKTNDTRIFELPEEAARLFKTIGGMIEDGCADSVIPLPNVHSDTLAKAIEYCKKHVGDDNDDDSDADWDKQFVGELDDNGLYDLMLAAHYLDLTGLLDLTCKAVADKMIMGKTTEQIRAALNIENDFTPAEEKEIREELAWAFGD